MPKQSPDKRICYYAGCMKPFKPKSDSHRFCNDKCNQRHNKWHEKFVPAEPKPEKEGPCLYCGRMVDIQDMIGISFAERFFVCQEHETRFNCDWVRVMEKETAIRERAEKVET